MMGGFARIVGIGMVGVIGACNSITGAEDLGDPNDSTELPARRREEPASAPLDNTSSTSSSGGSSGTPSEPDAGAPVDAGGDAPTLIGGGTDFLDDFNRADGVDVGNGWIEKVDSFSILKGQTRQSGVGSYRDLIVRRPEAALDVELSINVTHNRDIGDPALYARMQPTSSNLGTLVSYSFFAIRDFVEIDRDEGSKDQYTVLASQTLAEPIVAPYAYSLSLKVTGTNPVVIVATMKDANGNVKATLNYSDSSPGRITQPGAVGFGSGDALDARFDDFKRITY